MNKITLNIIFLIGIACQPTGKTEQTPVRTQEIEKDPKKIYNLYGAELSEKLLTKKQKEAYNNDLLIAKEVYTSNADSLEAIIWYGRRLAYLGKYIDAIEVYSQGLQIYPGSHQLYRHRGHRYLTTRQLPKAIKDFELAAYYSLKKVNAVEPDGLPNKLNKPLSNEKFNIWYHFGLTYYLSGRYDKALSAFNRCREFSDNDDLLTITTYWQYLTYMKLGNRELAMQLVEDFDFNITLIEYEDYVSLLKLFKLMIKPESIEKMALNKDRTLNPTLAYGIASYYQHTGELEKANELFLKILESPRWDAFGYIAAEAELKTIFPVP